MDIETTQQESPDTTSTAEGATRDELIAAAREAMNVAEPAAAEAGATTEQPAEVPAAVDPDEKINSVLRAREAAHKQRIEAENYATAQKRAADEERARILDEARAEAKRIADEELSTLRAKYRESPTAALRALANDPQEIVDAVLREGTPEARALAKAQEEVRLAREEAKAGSEAKKEVEKFLADQKREKEQAHYERVRDEFVSSTASRATAPALHAQYRSADGVFRALDAQCREWEADGLKRGVDFDDATLVAYAEKQSREWLREMGFSLAPAQQSGAGTASGQSGIAPKSAANGTRTITAASGSERRASPRPFHELTPDEQREDLIRVAQEAYRQHGKP